MVLGEGGIGPIPGFAAIGDIPRQHKRNHLAVTRGNGHMRRQRAGIVGTDGTGGTIGRVGDGTVGVQIIPEILDVVPPATPQPGSAGSNVGVAGGQGEFGIIDGIWLHLIVAHMDALPSTIVVRRNMTATLANEITEFIQLHAVTGVIQRKNQRGIEWHTARIGDGVIKNRPWDA